MTIQFDPKKRTVRVGDKHFPATPFRDSLAVMREAYPYGQGYTIPLGESGEELSIAIGFGSYSDNYDSRDFALDAEMEVVEVGFTENGEFDVIGYVDDEGLSRIIILSMQGQSPRNYLDV